MTSMTNQGKLIIVSGPSGAGKTTIIARTLDAFNSIVCAKSATTRKQRHNETSDNYYFLSNEEFNQKIENNDFLEWCIVHNNRYGTLKSEVIDQQNKGQHVLLEIDVQGTKKIQKTFPDCIKIFIAPPSIEILKQRLLERNTDSIESIEGRIEEAKRELASIDEYDYIIENINLDDSTNQLNHYLMEKLK